MDKTRGNSAKNVTSYFDTVSRSDPLLQNSISDWAEIYTTYADYGRGEMSKILASGDKYFRFYDIFIIIFISFFLTLQSGT